MRFDLGVPIALCLLATVSPAQGSPRFQDPPSQDPVYMEYQVEQPATWKEAADGLVVRASRGDAEIRIVDRKTMGVVGRFGRVGRQAGQFVAVHNVTVDKGGNIYTAEVNTGQRVQKFRRLDMQN